MRQPGLTFSPLADAVVADKVRTRFSGADDTAGSTKGRTRVDINDALDRYSEAALRRGLSRFDIALGLEGTSTGPETSASQGPFVAKNYLENTVDQNKGLRIRALRMNREPRTLELHCGIGVESVSVLRMAHVENKVERLLCPADSALQSSCCPARLPRSPHRSASWHACTPPSCAHTAARAERECAATRSALGSLQGMDTNYYDQTNYFP